jgi:hypothetical protein
MSVREFELYHGAVLTKILRSEKPVALRLVETPCFHPEAVVVDPTGPARGVATG